MKKLKTYLRMLGLVARHEPAWIPVKAFSYMFSRAFGSFYALFFMRHIINQLTERGPIMELLGFIALFGLWDVVGLTLRAWVAYWYEARANQRLDLALDEMMFAQLRQADIARFENPAFYDEIAVISKEFRTKFRRIIENFASILAYLFQICIAIVVMADIDATVLLFAVISLLASIPEKKGAALNVQMKKAAAPAERRADYVRQTMSARRTVGDLRLTRVFTVLTEVFTTAAAGLKANAREYGIRVALLRFVTEAMGWIIPHVAMYIYMGWRYLSGSGYTLGDFSALLNGVYNLTDGINDTIALVDEAMELSAYGEDFFRFLESKNELTCGERAPAFEKDITFENVTFCYPGSQTKVLDGVSFELRRGETVAVVGYNGAGKSTLVKLLLHLYEPQSGRITADGVDVRDCTAEGWRELFGCCFQDGQVYALPIRDNILAGRDCDLDRAIDRAETAAMIAKTSPKGVDGVMTREFDADGIVLSGGEQQKLLAARAYANDAPIMIFDEPTANLDPLAEYDFFQSLVRVAREKTLVFISHRLSAAQLADRILFMEHGRIVEAGSHAELMKRGGKYADMYLKQASSYIEKGVGA